MYCLLLKASGPVTTIILEFPVRSNWSHYILGSREIGGGSVKITLIVSCLEWLTCLFVFIMV